VWCFDSKWNFLSRTWNQKHLYWHYCGRSPSCIKWRVCAYCLSFYIVILPYTQNFYWVCVCVTVTHTFKRRIKISFLQSSPWIIVVLKFLWHEEVAAMLKKITVCWNATPHCLVFGYRLLGGASATILRVVEETTLNIAAIWSFETSVVTNNHGL